ncbi:MAG TPA: thiamine diphosphokinase [Bacillota bacterium]|nr:thiamine diphosphokinase [Bacillota bacterium]
MEKRILIFTGGQLGEWALEVIEAGDLVIGVDRGAWYLWQHGVIPDHAFGDFDSVSQEELSLLQKEIHHLVSCDPIMKDLTDTEMAFRWAILQQPSEIILLGATGSRFDHSLANVHLLYKGLEADIPCRIIDTNNEIRVISQTTKMRKGRFTHVSLLPLSMQVTGITLEGFLYPLNNATLCIGQSLGVSNIIVKEEGSISLSTGYLLVIQSKD